MRVAVVGATGLIGGALVAALADRGDVPLPVSRGGDTVRGVPGAAWDPADGPPPPEVVQVDAVVNLAGAGIGAARWTDDRKRVIRESRIQTTDALVQALGSGTAGVLVNASAAGYYGTGEETVDETSPAGDDFLAEVCTAWEAAAVAAEQRSVRVVLLRTGIVLASDGGALHDPLPPLGVSQLTLFRLGLGGPFGGGRQWQPWIHIADVVGAILLALDDDSLRGPLNLSAPAPVRQREFASALGRVLHRPAFVPTPGFALRILLGEMSTRALDGQRMLPAALQARGYDFRFTDLEAALRDLLA